MQLKMNSMKMPMFATVIFWFATIAITAREPGSGS
jgi:hypothetical protein